MAASGVETVRVAFDWRAAQPAEGGPIAFAEMDAVVAAAAARRLPVLPVVHRTPRWAAACRAGAASTPRGTAAYTAFLHGAGRPLRAGGLAVGGAAGAAAGADPRLADLERAEPHALLVEAAVREVLRAAAAGVAARAAGGGPGLADDPRRAAERVVGRAAEGLPRGRAGRVRRGRAASRTRASRSNVHEADQARPQGDAQVRRPAQAGVADGAVVAGVAGQDARARRGS